MAEERRTEWDYNGRTVSYSRPVTAQDHFAGIARFQARGEWTCVSPVQREQSQASSQPLRMTRDGAEHYYASLVLSDVSFEEAETQLAGIEIID